MKPVHIISLGAGVQSSCMALMAAKGEISPMPDCAVFADTKAEPPSVYIWLDWLEKQLPFPVHRVTAGSLVQDVMTLRMRKDNKGFYIHSGIPAFVVNKDGSDGIIPRQCTTKFKIEPLRKFCRKFGKVKRGCKEIKVVQWIGISLDEVSRMKESREPWKQNRWPLVDLRMSRHDCLLWLEKNNLPKPPRSACFFCPYKSNAEWQRLKTAEPEMFQRAILFEKGFQQLKKISGVNGDLYLHSSRKPLSEMDFDSEEQKGQINLFNNECEGMCGV